MTVKLAVYNDTTKVLEVVDPNQAVGVGLPAFKFGQVRPSVGFVKGEAFINQITGIASVWDGTNWNEVARPVVVPYADDTTILGVNAGNGTVALSIASGNIFTRVNNVWVPMGIRTFPTAVGMLATASADGTLGLAIDTGDFAVRAGGNWVVLSNQGVNVGNTAPTNPINGQLWLDTTTAGATVLKFYDGTNWVSGSKFPILAADPTNPTAGDVYYNTTDEIAKVYTGTAWAEMGGGDSEMTQFIEDATLTVDLEALYQDWNEVKIRVSGTGTCHIKLTKTGDNMAFYGVQLNEAAISTGFFWDTNHTTDKQFLPDVDVFTLDMHLIDSAKGNGTFEMRVRSGTSRITVMGEMNCKVPGLVFTLGATSCCSVTGIGKK